MRWIRTFLFLSLMAICGTNALATENVVFKKNVDLGTIQSGSRITLKVPWVENFQGQVKLVEMGTSCSCTAAKLTPGQLLDASDENSSSQLILNIPNVEQLFCAEIAWQIELNGQSVFEKTKICGAAKKHIKILPSSVALPSMLQAGGEAKLEIQLDPQTPEPATMDIESPVDWLHVQAEAVGKNRYLIRVNCDATAPAGLVDFDLKINAQLPDGTFMSLGVIPVWGYLATDKVELIQAFLSERNQTEVIPLPPMTDEVFAEAYGIEELVQVELTDENMTIGLSNLKATAKGFIQLLSSDSTPLFIVPVYILGLQQSE